MQRVIARVAAVAALLVAAGCASTGHETANDPFEPANRAVFAFNEKFDKYVVLLVADVYIYHTPDPVRTGLHNVVSNAALPVTFGNDVLQGESNRAVESLGRFLMNTTLGLGGLLDVASKAKMPPHTSDFGQTLAKYGVHEGPFLVLPIIGPEPPRDLVGDAVDLAMDPLTYVPPGWSLGERIGTAVGLHVANPFETHARNIFLRQELEKDSLDPYATMRNTYRQVRAQEIGGAAAAPEESLDTGP